MLIAIAFFAVWMFLFYRFPSPWLFGIASTLILGLFFLGSIYVNNGRFGVHAMGYWIGYATVWLLIGAAARNAGARAAVKRRKPDAASVSATFE